MIEGIDYYIENGSYVFTAKYLMKRGSCCSNGCRNCTYKENHKEVNMSNHYVSIKDSLVRNLVLGGPSGWWVRIADHDNVFFMSKVDAIKYLEDLLNLEPGALL